MSRKIPGSAIVPGTITVTQISGGLNDTTNAAYAQANTARDTGNNAYTQANTARSDANTTFATINTTFGTVNTSLGTINTNYQASYSQANTARDTGNSAYASANLAYTQANNARSDANTTFATLNTTFGTINTSLSTINSSFGTTNTNYQAAYAQANTARDTANNAYNNSNTKLSTSGGSISGDLSITGNLTVQGNATTINVSNLSVNDSIILLAAGGTGDSLDIGFVGHLQRGATDTHAGLIRKATQNQFYLFDNYEVEPTNNVIDVAGNNFRVGNLRLGIINANSYVTSAGMDVTGQANAAYAQANAARSDANTTFATVNTTFGTINTNYQAAYAQANTARTTANDAYGQANSAYGAANNRVLKAGDTMTGNLTLSAASLVLSSTSNDQRLIDAEGTSATGRHVAFPLRFMIGSASSGYPFAGYNAIPRANGAYSYSTSDTAWGISYGNSSRMGFYYAASGTPGANISFSELMTIAASGNVGIGSGTPAQKLDVAGAVQSTDYRVASSAVFYLTGDEFRFRTTGGTERLRIDSSGNIGIGTTNPGALFQVWGSSRFSQENASWTFDDTNNRRLGFVKKAGYYPYLAIASGADFAICHSSNTDLGTSVSGQTLTERFYVNSSGNVGIGTASPGTKLDIEGSGAGGLLHINNITAGKSAMLFQDNGSQKLIIGLAGIWEGNSSTDAAIAAETGLNIRFYTNGSSAEKMRISTSGNVGINRTDPQKKLDVKITDTASGTYYAAHFGGSTHVAGYAVGIGLDPEGYGYRNKIGIIAEGDNSGWSIGKLHFALRNDTGTGTEAGISDAKMTIQPNGNVGIGTTSPGQKLEVAGNIFVNTSGNPYLELKTSGAGNNPYLRLTAASNYWDIQGTFSNTNDELFFMYNGSTRLAIQSGGNVGIATTSPAYTLDVNGTIGASYTAAAHHMARSRTTFTVGGSSSNFYPVIISIWGGATSYQYSSFIIERGGYEDPGYTGIGFSNMHAKFSLTASGWGFGSDYIAMDHYKATYNAIAKWYQEFQTSRFVIWLRGATQYNLLNVVGTATLVNGNSGGTQLVTDYNTYTVESSVQSYATYTRVNDGTLWQDGNLNVTGTLSKAAGSFKIDHPLPQKSNTNYLVHSFIEGPQADLYYSGKTQLQNGLAIINIDSVSNMTEGTFEALCRNIRCFVTNESNWDLVRGSVENNLLTIVSQNSNSTANVSWLVVGERKDKFMLETDWTDDEGRVIVEPAK